MWSTWILGLVCLITFVLIIVYVHLRTRTKVEGDEFSANLEKRVKKMEDDFVKLEGRMDAAEQAIKHLEGHTESLEGTTDSIVEGLSKTK